MKKFILFVLLIPILGLSQNACKKCSQFSATNNWSELLLCLSDEIKKSENINDYMCRVQCYGVIFQREDSLLLEIDNIKKFYSKRDILNLTMIDLDYIIKKDSLFANGLPSNQRMQIKNLLTE
ncbi:MAG: hypothetical protein P8H35_03870 [Flavobacteriales bacterium]|jgi:hypothetical protein|nr:hypothetical protein [Flavobacteriales bacterium]